MGNGTWSSALQQMQQTGGGLAPRAGQPGMGAGGFPYAKGLMASGRAGPSPRSLSPMPPAASAMPSSSSRTPMDSGSPGVAGSTPPAPSLPPQVAQQIADQLFAILKQRVMARQAGY